MASCPCVTIFFLLSSTLTQIVVSGHGQLFPLSYFLCILFTDLSKAYDVSQWPKPECEMYYPEPNFPAYCPDVTSYICATTGRTYQNECFLCVDQAPFN
ncbi:serine protease inhibitor Kazal-type 13 [Orycteropus afer afer]|uniref:Serine protease inhibitor Kazal-type 13 n=1 Tax=Orycteropus afer afer TaxID=1230840 RepID=A0AC54Z3B8_ORYAF|nr:serine protease inhibitor Kazal-type 13 [Orycteropus afer afer]